MLKTYFEAGITPEFAENPEDANALKGGLKLLLVRFSTAGLEKYLE